jgi:hypothetical protein
MGVRAPPALATLLVVVLATLALDGLEDVLEVIVRVLPAVDGGVFMGLFGASFRMCACSRPNCEMESCSVSSRNPCMCAETNGINNSSLAEGLYRGVPP